MPSLTQLLQALPEYTLTSAVEPALISATAVTGDSRAVMPGALFVAVIGDIVDGHHFIPAAIDSGVVAVIGEKSLHELRLDESSSSSFGTTIPYVQVADARVALAVCAAALHDFPSRTLTTVGVTGTDGKTTTATILESILAAATCSPTSPHGRVGVITTVGARILGREQATGFHVTTPDAPQVQQFLAAMRDAGCTHAIVESTSHGLAQQRVAAVEYDLTAVTNITHEHLDYHGTRDAYVAAKARLFRMLYASAPTPGAAPRVAVLNADDDGSVHALRQALAEEAAANPELSQHVTIRTYGMAEGIRVVKRSRVAQRDSLIRPDVTADVVSYQPARTTFDLHWWGGVFGVETPLIGDFNVYNILCAATIALAFGVDPQHVQQGVRELRGVIGRMERIDRGQEFLALVDFAHSPASLERALLTLRQLVGQGSADGSGRLIALFGSAGLRDHAKRGLMGQVSGRLADFTIITAEDPRTEDLDAINQAIAAGVHQYADENADVRAYIIVPDRTEAIQYAVDMARTGDVVAAFGKGHERSMCFGETEYPWSDQQAMRDALDRRIARES